MHKASVRVGLMYVYIDLCVCVCVCVISHSFLQKFSPTKSESKVVSPHLLLPPKFGLCITGFHKLTTNTLSTCVISCNFQEQKQVSRSKLIFQVHKQTQSYTQPQEIANEGIGNSLYFKQKIFCL